MHVYIDLGYAERLFQVVSDRVFARDLRLDVGAVARTIGNPRKKVFVYDCEPEPQRQGESRDDYDRRLRRHDTRLREIELLPDTHVRCGRLVHRKRKRDREQKRVDVNIAVDMLTHAFRGVMDDVLFVAGDDDFTPLLRAMMDTPCRVTLACDARFAHHDLRASATNVFPLTVVEVGKWSASSSNTAPNRLMPCNAPAEIPSNCVVYTDQDVRLVTRSAPGKNSIAWIDGAPRGYAADNSTTAARAVCFSNGLDYDALIAAPGSYAT